jgi:hypothetical protein
MHGLGKPDLLERRDPAGKSIGLGILDMEGHRVLL